MHRYQSAGPSGMRNIIPVWYSTVFLKNPGIPVFFGTVIASYFHPMIFWKLFVFPLSVPFVINLESFHNCFGLCIYRVFFF